MTDGVEIRIPARTCHLGTVRCFFRSFAREELGVSPDSTAMSVLELELHEACVNAIRHGSIPGGNDVIRVVLESNVTELTMEVHDSGQGFDIDDVPVPMPQTLAEGGYGVHIIRQSMDRVSGRRTDDGFVLTMTKDLARPGSCVTAGAE